MPTRAEHTSVRFLFHQQLVRKRHQPKESVHIGDFLTKYVKKEILERLKP